MRAAKKAASSACSAAGAARATSAAEIGSSWAVFHVWYAHVWMKNGNPSERSTIASVAACVPLDTELACRLDDGDSDLIGRQRPELGDDEHALGVGRRLGDVADEVGKAGQHAEQRQPVLAAAVDAGEHASQVVLVEQLRLVDRDHHADVVVGGGRGEVDHHVAERVTVGRRVGAIDLEPGAEHGERHRVDRPQGAQHLAAAVEALGDAPALAEQRAQRVVAADRLDADHAEPVVFAECGELAQQHGLADAAQAGDHQLLVRPGRLETLHADVGGLDDAVAADERRRGVPAPGAYGLAIGSYRSTDMP